MDRLSPTRPLLSPWPTAVLVALLLSLFFSLRVPRPDLASHLGAKSHEGQRFRARARSVRDPTILCSDQIVMLGDPSFQKSIGSMAARKPGVIALFDVDGTLTAPRKLITPQMLEFMRELREVVTVGVVGGSDLVKITEQLGKTVVHDYDYVFSENGLLAHKNGELIGRQVFPRGWDKTYSLKYLGEFQEIHFFGDKTYKGGNDYEIYESKRTVGHTVTSPDDTAAQCRSLFLGN